MGRQHVAPASTANRGAAKGAERSPPLPVDGWIGTLEFPGYRAGAIVAKLVHLPELLLDRLYLDLLLLDETGRARETQGGACQALQIDSPVDARSRFVRVLAELMRHAADEAHRFSALAPPLALLCEMGIQRMAVRAAAQLLDTASHERSVTRSLVDMLLLSLGEDEAQRVLRDVIERLPQPAANDAATRAIAAITTDSLHGQVARVVHAVGKHRARRHLQVATDFDLVPDPAMFGL